MFGSGARRSASDNGGGVLNAGEKPVSPDRPVSIGIALSGGAARGWAHIGVLRAFDEAAIRPEIVVGTSVGAVVGGCYVAGLLDGLEAFARGLTRRRVFGLLDLSFSGSGLIAGNRLSKLLEAQLHDKRIEDLSRRFVCVATELGTGHEIWLTRGKLVEALRASYALPGIFQPMRLNNRWLVDGALVNPVPVSVCRALGANVVIGINLTADTFGRGTVIRDYPDGANGEMATDPPPGAVVSERDARRILRRQLIGRNEGPPGVSSVMVEAFNIIQDRISRSRLAGDPPDLLVSPKLGSIGLFDFHRAAEAIDIGYETCRKMTPEIREVIAELS